MITEKVIKEIYRKFRKPPHSWEELNIDFYTNILSEHHKIREDEDEIIFDDLEEFNPFRRILKRRLHAVLEFDFYVAFVTPTHILFLNKENNQVRICMKPEKSDSFFNRIFAR